VLMRSISRILALGAAALLPACGGGGGSSVPTLQPDFSLLDVNPNSASTGTNVSPRAYLGLVPAFYFGHAT
jgi:hypothetical protein